uniref:Uncharacterized protein n=2 Tax=Oryza TaxID=4527 RepID=A0A0D9ZVR3_9ORYZ
MKPRSPDAVTCNAAHTDGKFTDEIYHGGSFVSYGSSKAYIDEKMIFKQCLGMTEGKFEGILVTQRKDSDDTIAGVYWEDVVAHPVSQLPKVEFLKMFLQT